MTLATNHVLDQDLYGIKVTAAFYQGKDGMTYIGIHPPGEAAMTPAQAVKIMEVNGIRLALLNATYGTNGRPSPEEYPYVVERFRRKKGWRLSWIMRESMRTQSLSLHIGEQNTVQSRMKNSSIYVACFWSTVWMQS